MMIGFKSRKLMGLKLHQTWNKRCGILENLKDLFNNNITANTYHKPCLQANYQNLIDKGSIHPEFFFSLPVCPVNFCLGDITLPDNGAENRKCSLIFFVTNVWKGF